MSEGIDILEHLYDRFNARDIESVLVMLADEVIWANGMDGGHVHGREAVRAYWSGQLAKVSPYVEPVAFRQTEDGVVMAEVNQSVFDLEGDPLEGQAHGLKDKTFTHVFRFRDGKIVRFDIEDLG